MNSKQRRKAWRKRNREMVAEIGRLQNPPRPPRDEAVEAFTAAYNERFFRERLSVGARYDMALELMRDTDDEGNPVTPVITTPAEFFAVLGDE
jgi:hypothetical protein